MKQIPNYGDQRMLGQCIYCGGSPETREHVPPRVFLDIPYPANLPVVGACSECNGGFSPHEEYLACLIECVISGSADPDHVKRDKIARILKERPYLANRIHNARTDQDGMTIFSVEHDRVRLIVEKIARGHVLYEVNELVDEPVEFSVTPFTAFTDEERIDFEGFDQTGVDVWPEVGSRSMQRLLVADDTVFNGWIEVQPDRYRYAVSQPGGIEVRMVFSEYLACRVLWD